MRRKKLIKVWEESLREVECITGNYKIREEWKLDQTKELPRGVLGQANFDERLVRLNDVFVKQANAREIKDTILHELAHVLAGLKAGHGEKWERVAKTIGASPNAGKVIKLNWHRKADLILALSYITLIALGASVLLW